MTDTAGHGQRVDTGCVILAGSGTPQETWWLVDANPKVGVNAELVHGKSPFHGGGRRTHWSNKVVRDQGAIINPPADIWPEAVTTAVAAFALIGRTG